MTSNGSNGRRRSPGPHEPLVPRKHYVEGVAAALQSFADACLEDSAVPVVMVMVTRRGTVSVVSNAAAVQGFDLPKILAETIAALRKLEDDSPKSGQGP